MSNFYPSRIRTIDGSDNNGDRGEAESPLIRLFEPAFEDGISIPRGGEISGVDPISSVFFDSSSLPNPRTISNIVNNQVEPTPNLLNASNWLWQWGQLLDHDFGLNESNAENPGEFSPIVVPDGDPTFSDGSFLPFIRVPAAEGTGETTPRQVINQITSFIDGSLVYGSDEERAEFLRDSESGRGLLNISFSENGEVLLPLNPIVDGEPEFENATGGVLGELQFVAGDIRANEQLGLNAGHTLLVREHNRIAEELFERLENDDASLLDLFVRREGASFSEATTEQIDGFIYEAARQVIGAQIQAISYNEFLPLLIGDVVDQYSGFDAGVNPQISIEFANAAFRLGHTFLTEDIRRLDGDGIKDTSLADAFFDPEDIQANGVDNVLAGLIFQTAEEVDHQLVDGVRNFLFPAGGGGLDLASVNIARGRETGIPGYTEIYENIFGTEIDSFDDLGSTGLGLISDHVVGLLETAYESVDQIDLWVGGISELAVNGGLLGPTFSFFIADQFTRVRDGDEFFYLDSEQQSTLQILDPDVNDSNLADLIRNNVSVADSYLVTDNPFINPTENEILGTEEAEILLGTHSSDLIDALDGDDIIQGFQGNDLIVGGLGNDKVGGGSGEDTILGGAGSDTIRGNNGDDTLVGGEGDDTLLGNRGDDVIDGQAGSDSLNGGLGADTFVFASDILEDGHHDSDTIRQFRPEDSFDFSDYVAAGGTVSFERINNGFLTINLSGEDTVDLRGNSTGIDSAEQQLIAADFTISDY